MSESPNKQKQPQPPTPAAPALPDPEFGGDPEVEDQRAARLERAVKRVPTLGTPGDGPRPRPLWNVLVRHTSFLFKQSNVYAATRAEAKAIFMEAVKARHEEIAKRQKGPNKEKDAERVWDAYRHGLQHQRDHDGWVIRPAEEVKAERQKLRDRTERRWGPAEMQAR